MSSETLESRILQVLDLLDDSFDLEQNINYSTLVNQVDYYGRPDRVHSAIAIFEGFKDLELELIEKKGGFEQGTGNGDEYFCIWKTAVDFKELYFKKEALYYSHHGVDDYKPALRVYPKIIKKTDYLILEDE